MKPTRTILLYLAVYGALTLAYCVHITVLANAGAGLRPAILWSLAYAVPAGAVTLIFRRIEQRHVRRLSAGFRLMIYELLLDLPALIYLLTGPWRDVFPGSALYYALGVFLLIVGIGLINEKRNLKDYKPSEVFD